MRAALGKGDGALERGNALREGDVVGGPGQPVAAAGTALGHQQAGALEPLEHLALRRQGHTGTGRQLPRRARLAGARQLG